MFSWWGYLIRTDFRENNLSTVRVILEKIVFQNNFIKNHEKKPLHKYVDISHNFVSSGFKREN